MKQVQRRLEAVGAVSVLGGVVLVFAAIGGLDNPEQEAYWLVQICLAVVGLAWMWLGARLLRS